MKTHYDSMFEIKNMTPAENYWQARIHHVDDSLHLKLTVKRVVGFAVVATRPESIDEGRSYASDWIAPLTADEIVNVLHNGDFGWIAEELQDGYMTTVYAHNEMEAWRVARQSVGRDKNREVVFLYSDAESEDLHLDDEA